MALSMEETKKLRQAWGDKPCTHPNITKERGPMGQQTDYACTICGAVSWNKSELEEEGKRVEESFKENTTFQQ